MLSLCSIFLFEILRESPTGFFLFLFTVPFQTVTTRTSVSYEILARTIGEVFFPTFSLLGPGYIPGWFPSEDRPCLFLVPRRCPFFRVPRVSEETRSRLDFFFLREVRNELSVDET